MFHCTITRRRGQDSEEIIIHHFTLPIIHLTYHRPLKKLDNHCLLLSITIVSREIKENAYANFWSVNKISVSWEMFKWRVREGGSK